MWKVGSEPQSLTPDPADPLDPVDPVTHSKKHVWEQHSITFAYFGDPKTPSKLVFDQRSVTFVVLGTFAQCKT